MKTHIFLVVIILMTLLSCAAAACINKTGTCNTTKNTGEKDVFALISGFLGVGVMFFWYPISIAICRHGFGVPV